MGFKSKNILVNASFFINNFLCNNSLAIVKRFAAVAPTGLCLRKFQLRTISIPALPLTVIAVGKGLIEKMGCACCALVAMSKRDRFLIWCSRYCIDTRKSRRYIKFVRKYLNLYLILIVLCPEFLRE
jgi:hypothetical protein